MKRKGSAWIIIGLLLITAALGLVIYNVLDDLRAARAASETLESILADIIDSGISSKPDYYGKDMPTVVIDGVEYIGVLSIPDIGIALPVKSEWSYVGLRTSPCRFVGSAYKNDLVICAHNYEHHFGQLKNLEYGTKVILTDVVGNVFTYKISEIETLAPTAVEEMTVGEDWDMTLFTCTIGGRTRVTVRCSLDKSEHNN